MDIRIVNGTADDIDSFICFLDEVRANMEHKEWFYLDPAEEVRKMMDEGILELWLAKDGGRTAGAFDIIRPGRRSFNYGYDLQFSDDDLDKVINMDSAAVHPDYRGYSLQRKLIQCAEDQLCKEGDHILLCTVHPDNCYSLKNVMKQGYAIEKKLEKYGSVRYLLRKDIKNVK